MTFSAQIPDNSIRVSFYDKDGTRVDNVTKEQAKIVADASPGKLFYFQDKDGLQRELTIEQVLNLKPETDLISDTALSDLSCPTDPQPCGPPKVQFFGGEGVGAMANAVISPLSSGVMAFDIVSPGKNYTSAPVAVLQDECGKGSGSCLDVLMDGDKVQNLYVCAQGDGYLDKFDGSLGGNGRTWKEADEGYVKTKDGNYYTVPGNDPPPDLQPGDIWNPPPLFDSPTSISNRPDKTNSTNTPSYPVLISFDDVVIEDGGFGYTPNDTIKVTPDKGTVIEPIINKRGEVVNVNIVSKGSGFQDIPEILVESKTGFNAVLRPILKVERILTPEDALKVPPGLPLVVVVDCVGKIAPRVQFDLVPR